MKALFTVIIISFLSFVGKGQSSQDKEAIKKVVIAFQDDYNEGSFKNAEAYSTSDWRHINPGGGIDKDETVF